MSTALEDQQLQIHQRTALEAVKQEFPKYFDALQQHPRLLVGIEVPSLKGEGTEILRDSSDARDWQEAVKDILSDEIKARAETSAESDREVMQTLHSSIDLFKNNSDLVPGTKQFDRELADKLMEVAAPYVLRAEGRLMGFSIPMQPLIDQLRTQLTATRSAAAAAAAAAPPVAPAVKQAPQEAAQSAPQAGISSKAGSSAEADDFSTLFGTLGMPSFRV